MRNLILFGSVRLTSFLKRIEIWAAELTLCFSSPVQKNFETQVTVYNGNERSCAPRVRRHWQWYNHTCKAKKIECKTRRNTVQDIEPQIVMRYSTSQTVIGSSGVLSLIMFLCILALYLFMVRWKRRPNSLLQKPKCWWSKCCSERSFFNSDWTLGPTRYMRHRRAQWQTASSTWFWWHFFKICRWGWWDWQIFWCWLHFPPNQDACLGNANHGDDSSIFYVDTHAGAGLYEVKALYDPNSWGKEASHNAVGFVL